MDAPIMDYFLTQGPFAVLFIWLLFRSEKRNETREGEYKTEITQMHEKMEVERKEWRKERLVWTETLQKFSDKYDVIIDELHQIKTKIK